MKETYNIYNVEINDDDDSGVYAISLVESPAMEMEYLLFDKVKFDFKIENEEKRLVHGVIIRANTPILRKDGEEFYYVNFSKETILKIVEKYTKNNYNNQVTIDHNKKVENVYLLESYIKDNNRNKSTNFDDITEGSWIGTFKVENDQVWEDIKNNNKWTGFSIESLLNVGEIIGKTTEKEYVIEDFDNEKDMIEILSILKKII